MLDGSVRLLRNMSGLRLRVAITGNSGEADLYTTVFNLATLLWVSFISQWLAEFVLLRFSPDRKVYEEVVYRCGGRGGALHSAGLCLAVLRLRGPWGLRGSVVCAVPSADHGRTPPLTPTPALRRSIDERQFPRPPGMELTLGEKFNKSLRAVSSKIFESVRSGISGRHALHPSSPQLLARRPSANSFRRMTDDSDRLAWASDAARRQTSSPAFFGAPADSGTGAGGPWALANRLRLKTDSSDGASSSAWVHQGGLGSHALAGSRRSLKNGDMQPLEQFLQSLAESPVALGKGRTPPAQAGPAASSL